MTIPPEWLVFLLLLATALGFVLGVTWVTTFSFRLASTERSTRPPALPEGTDLQVVTRAGWLSQTLPSMPAGSGGRLNADVRVPGLRQLHEEDPSFDRFTFMQRATTTCFALGRARESHNLQLVKELVSNRLLQRWAASPASMPPALPEGNLLLSLAGCRKERGGYILTVRVDGNDSGPSDEPTRFGFTQWWEFVRGSGNPLTHCPVCGAPIKDPQLAVCHFCQAALPKGPIDWIVDSVAVRPEKAATAA